MEVSCEIIRDILPLYAEDLVSEATRALVDDHLCGCDACTVMLGKLKKPQLRPVDTDTGALERLRKGIRTRRILTALAALATAVSLVISGTVFLITDLYLPADKAIEGVELREDGSLVVDYARGHIGQGGFCGGTVGSDEYFFCRTRRYDWLKARYQDRQLAKMSPTQREDHIKGLYETEELTQKHLDRFYTRNVRYCFANGEGRQILYHESELDQAYHNGILTPEGEYTRTEHSYNLCYLSRDGSVDKVLWNGADRAPEEPELHSAKLLWTQTFALCLLGTAGLILWCFCFGKEKRQEWQVTLMLALASLAFAIGLASNLDFSWAALNYCSYNWWDDVLWTAPAVFVTALLWRKLQVLSSQEKGLN